MELKRKKKNKISRKGSLKMYSSFSKKFRQIKPYDNYNVTDVPWHEAMVAGNGRLGGRAKTCALRCYSTVR